MENTTQKALLVGYWPLLDLSKLKPGEITQNDKIFNILNIDVPAIKAVLWAGYPFNVKAEHVTEVIPVFIMDQATDVANHMLQWLENDNSRFKLHFEQRDSGYAVVLIPSVSKSIDRWKTARRIFYNEDVDDTYEFTVAYKTLGVICPGGKTFETVKDRIGKKCRVGFLDTGKCNVTNPELIDDNDIVIAGPFEVADNNDEIAQTHINALFEDYSTFRTKHGP